MPNPPDPDLLAARADLFGGVFVLVSHLTRRTDAALADWGLTTRQWLLLAVLSTRFAGQAPSLTEAADAYGSSRQNVKAIAAGLAERGWLHLVADPLDGRTTRLALTEKVRMFDAPEGRARAEALLADAFAGLEPDETHALRALVARWVRHLAPPAGTAG